MEVAMLAQSLSVRWKPPVKCSHSKAASSAHIICFAQIFRSSFHLITQFASETTITQISHGFGENNYWFAGVHSFELRNARGGVLNILGVVRALEAQPDMEGLVSRLISYCF